MAAEEPSAAAASKRKKGKRKNVSGKAMGAIMSDVVSFASSIGLAGGGGPASGFDDTDFRKPGKMEVPVSDDPEDANRRDRKHDSDKPVPKEHPLQKFNPFSRDGGSVGAKYPLMKPSSLSSAWHVDSAQLEERVLSRKEDDKTSKLGGGDAAKALKMGKEVGELLLKQFETEYDAEKKKDRGGGEMKMIKETVRSGTSADRVSAFVVLVHDNPIANVRALDALLSMVTSKVGKRHAFSGFIALKDLFLDRLLPDRKLKYLVQRPLHTLPENKDGYSLLLFWYWEDFLKQRYEKFVVAVEEASRDILPNLKDSAMKMVFELLKTKSEQERRLLTALVNKLGDPERKAASNASYHLTCLLSEHPNMKAVVVDEVELFIFRPHVGMRAKYYAVNFLNKFFLSKKGDGPKLAKRLVDLYFAVFKVVITGYEKEQDKKIGTFRKQKGKREEAKATKFQPGNEKEGTKESFEMDSRLLSALLSGVNRAFPYVASEEVDDVIEVQMPVLFRLVHSENFNVGVQALMLLYQITVKNQIASDRFYRALYSKFLSPTAITSSKTELFVSLLTKAMKNDVSLKRVAAFSKRLLQVALQRPPEYACGCLFLLSEVLKAKPPLWTLVLQKESVDDDDLEHFEDIIEPDDTDINSSKDAKASASQGTKSPPELKMERGQGVEKCCEEENNASNSELILPGGYDPKHREPSFCNADHTSWWELAVLASHLHPSVATMARTLLSGANIVYNGDPLYDLSLPAFLDKFKEKKPKANPIAQGKWYGGSQIAPSRKLDMNPRLIGEELLQLAEEEVPPEDVVFHRFYTNRTVPRKKAKKSDDDIADEDDLLGGISDESDEEEIDEMLGTGIADREENFDYDDLDRVNDDSDEELIGDDDHGDNTGIAEFRNDPTSDDEKSGFDVFEADDHVLGGEEDDGDGDAAPEGKGKKKRKVKGKAGASPFASLDEYEHLFGDDADNAGELKPRRSKRRAH